GYGGSAEACAEAERHEGAMAKTYNSRMPSSSQSRIALPSWTAASVDRPMEADRKRDLYRALLFPPLVEEKMLILLRQGRLSKWFSGIGQEAIAVCVA